MDYHKPPGIWRKPPNLKGNSTHQKIKKAEAKKRYWGSGNIAEDKILMIELVSSKIKVLINFLKNIGKIFHPRNKSKYFFKGISREF